MDRKNKLKKDLTCILFMLYIRVTNKGIEE